MKTKAFRSLVPQYKAVLFDSFGVLKDYYGLIDGAKHTIDFLNEQNIPYLVLTNDASRSPAELAEAFNKRGLHDITPEKIISSGMMAYEYLSCKVKGGKVAYLGTEESAHYIEATGLETVSMEELDLDNLEEISALVFLDDEGFDWFKGINKAINLLRKVNIPAVIANTDRTYPVSKHQVAIAIGGIADMIEPIVRKQFIRFGKPDAQMFIYAFTQLQQLGTFEKHEVLMVGDTLSTDIIGGNKFGLDTALVLTGNTPPDRVKSRIRSTGIIPNHVCDSIGL